MSVIERIESLYLYRGRRSYEGDPHDSVSALEHALQTAQLAEWDDADEALTSAAFLHDIGQLLPMPPGADSIDDVHELRAVAFLSEAFPAEVLEPVRLHVQAKRYLVSIDPGYAARLSASSRLTLGLQGGLMNPFEMRLFEELPYFAEAVRLRRWDDQARKPGQRTPPLAWCMDLLESVERRVSEPPRIAIASFSTA